MLPVESCSASAFPVPKMFVCEMPPEKITFSAVE
jgi:hypothetical protein